MDPNARNPHPRLGHPSTSITDLFRLDNRTILIAGGGGAVGLEVAKSVLETGGDVILLDRAEQPLNTEGEWQRVQDAARQHQNQVLYYACDITDPSNLQRLFVGAISQTRFPLRGLVTCHGLSAGGPALDFPTSTLTKLLDVNVTGTFSIAQLCAREFQRTNSAGSIVLFASMSAHVYNKGVDTAAYNASKAAIVQLARSLAGEWGSRVGTQLIRVNTVSPGYIRTRQTAETLAEPGMDELWSEGNMLGRLSFADEYRGAVQYLLSDASSFVTGTDLRVDGGHTAW
ncbi:hypothetical protein LTR70_001997 [Exophiala xenobiotica]|uniref:Ketoreductase domain-containing protein n=1 Tax=Lithohypha guttulata TaxID=1690604 RepID=A0ABR0KA36_9EURO|nr:hypothetical protein LTR24_005076 [Lithohypha guttulata]KAK5326233.1 hypothetical protein LTR70_001997 [Exophiala xenobiotica]